MSNRLLYKTNNRIEHHYVFKTRQDSVQISGVRLFLSVDSFCQNDFLFKFRTLSGRNFVKSKFK